METANTTNSTCSLFQYRPPQTRNLDIFPTASRKKFENALRHKYAISGTCTFCDSEDSKGTKLLKCGRCHEAKYCDKNCQVYDHPVHKLVCSQIARAVRPSAAEGDKSVAGPWKRIFVFFPDETRPTLQWARDYHETAFESGMSIQYLGRYCDFLTSQTPMANDTPGLNGGPHYDLRRIGRTLIEPAPSLDHALILTTLGPYKPQRSETVNKAVLALSHPGHANLIFGPVCILAFEGTEFPGKLRDVSPHDFHHAVTYLSDNITTPAVGPLGAVLRCEMPCVPALKITSCMDLTLIEDAESSDAQRVRSARRLRYQPVAVTVAHAHQRQWPSAIAFYVGLFWYVREVVGFSDRCGVDRAARWLLLSLKVNEDEELAVEREEYEGSLVVFSGDGDPVREEDLKLLAGYYRAEADDAVRMSDAFTNWVAPMECCIFREARLQGGYDVKGDCCELMTMVVNEGEKLLAKINEASKGAELGP